MLSSHQQGGHSGRRQPRCSAPITIMSYSVVLDNRMLIPICIFAKPPVAGEVKRRFFIPALGAGEGRHLANAMMVDVWHTVGLCAGVRPILATTPSMAFPCISGL